MWGQWSSDPCQLTTFISFTFYSPQSCTCTYFLVIFFFLTTSFRASGRFAHVSSAELLAVNPSRWSLPTSCCTSPSSSISWSFYSHLQVSQHQISLADIKALLRWQSYIRIQQIPIVVYWSLHHIYIRNCSCQWLELVPVHTVAQGSWPLLWKENLHTQRSVKRNDPASDVTPHLRLFSLLSDWFHMNQKRAATGNSLDSTPHISNTDRSHLWDCTFPFLSSSQNTVLSQQSSPKILVVFCQENVSWPYLAV